MEGGRRDREVSAVRKWRDGGTEIGVSGGKRDCRGGGQRKERLRAIETRTKWLRKVFIPLIGA